MLLLTLAGCQANLNGEKTKKRPPETPTRPFWAIMHGKIHLTSAISAKNKYIITINNCTDTDSMPLTGLVGVRRLFNLMYNQSEYRMRLHSAVYKDSACVTTGIVYFKNFDSLAHATFATSKDFIKGIDSVLSGPKKFNIDFHTYPPFDTARVDFTLPDSSKVSK
jgi:hypothetical protein